MPEWTPEQKQWFRDHPRAVLIGSPEMAEKAGAFGLPVIPSRLLTDDTTLFAVDRDSLEQLCMPEPEIPTFKVMPTFGIRY